MQTVMLLTEAMIVLGAILLGVRAGGVGIGLWGGVGTALLVFVFGEDIGAPPVDALLIIVAVILATSVLQAAGGIDWMISLAARVIVKRPRSVTIVAPLVSFLFSVGAGTSNILFSLLPVIQEVAERSGVRPSKPMSVSVVATSVALACSPVSAAMAVMVSIMDVQPAGGWSILQIMVVTVPAAAVGIVVTSMLVSRWGGPDTRPAVTARDAPPGITGLTTVTTGITPRARASALVYFAGVLSVVAFGLFPALRPSNGEGDVVGVGVMIQLVMLVTSTAILIVGRPQLDSVPSADIFRGGMVAAIAFFGLAWMINTFLDAHAETVFASLGEWVQAWPFAMAIAVFLIAVLTTSQSTATLAIVPIGLDAGIPIGLTVGLWVGGLGGIYLLPTNGLQIAAAAFDQTGSTKLGRRLYDHSFFVPSIMVTLVTMLAGAAIGSIVRH